MRTWWSLNPDYHYMLLSDADCDAFVAAHAEGWGTTYGGGDESEDEGRRPRVDPDVLTWLLDRKHYRS